MKNLLTLLALSAFGFSAVALAQETTPATKTVEVKELSSTNFDKEVGAAKGPVLVDFTAYWCGPCQMLKPNLEALAPEFAGKVTFTKVEVTQNPGLATKYGVTMYPTMKIVGPDGKVLATKIGYTSVNDLRTWVQTTLDAYNQAQKAKQGNTNGGTNGGNAPNAAPAVAPAVAPAAAPSCKCNKCAKPGTECSNGCNCGKK